MSIRQQLNEALEDERHYRAALEQAVKVLREIGDVANNTPPKPDIYLKARTCEADLRLALDTKLHADAMRRLDGTTL